LKKSGADFAEKSTQNNRKYLDDSFMHKGADELLKKGACLKKVNKQSMTVFDLIKYREHEFRELQKVLLTHGMILNLVLILIFLVYGRQIIDGVKNQQNDVVLKAVEGAIKAELDLKAVVNYTNRNGRTPLHFCAKKQKFTSFSFLVSKGAMMTGVYDKNGKDPGIVSRLENIVFKY
jgi:hypothetical protein